MSKILSEEVDNADSREDVVRKLGPGVILAEDDPWGRKYRNQPPSNLPEGIQQSDMFVQYYGAEGFALVLQFRNGKLVNHVLPEPRR